ncbi:MAG: nuclear transport factor 2 family protein [Pseudomonadota bacterium]
MTFRDEISAFFTRYIEAFAKRDADAIAALWEPVGLFPSPTGNFAMEREAFRAHCVGLLEFYQGQGVTEPTGELLSAEELFPNVALARMAYRMLSGDREVIADWQHVYLLRKTDDWRVSLTIADDEMAAWTARGAQL